MIDRRALSVKEIAEKYSVNEHTVLSWIRSGELRAMRVNKRLGSKKPRWRVTREALEAFEILRTETPQPTKIRHLKKRQPEVIEFYK